MPAETPEGRMFAGVMTDRQILMTDRQILLAACLSTLALFEWHGRHESHPTPCGCSLCGQIKILRAAIACVKGDK